MSETLADMRKRLMVEHGTQNNTYNDFPVGTIVQVITPCEDFTFFTVGTEGVVIENTYKYLGIMVRFEDKTKFNFKPTSLKVIQTPLTSDSIPSIPVKTYSEEQYTKDLQEFAEWCGLHYDWNPKLNVWMNNKGSKTTSQLHERWEVETGRREKP